MRVNNNYAKKKGNKNTSVKISFRYLFCWNLLKKS